MFRIRHGRVTSLASAMLRMMLFRCPQVAMLLRGLGLHGHAKQPKETPHYELLSVVRFHSSHAVVK
jgi:hypothetical protein